LIVLPGEPELECAGKYGSSCGKNPTPEFSGNYSAELAKGDFNYVLGLRYLGETDTLNSDNIDFEAKTYVDATVKYSWSENINFTIGASNLFDEDPVYTSSAGTAPGNGNTFPGYFDALGTYIFLNISVQY
jgi:outer membrane receptor protein involved in Fe transport